MSCLIALQADPVQAPDEPGGGLTQPGGRAAPPAQTTRHQASGQQSRVVDPNAFNLDPDPKCWPILNPDPGLINHLKKKNYKKKNSIKFFF